jgi:beta-glucosidase-like glycosyl hydrolase
MVLALQYGREFYEQLQNQSRGQPHLRIRPRIAATCKHWAAYSLEAGRFNFSAEIEQRDWDDTFTPSFQACIRAEQFLNEHFGRSVDVINPSGGLGVMCSYNAINGTPSCANREVLSKLRKDWEFKGYVVSDCWAIANIFENHHYASSYQEAVGMALRAGVDLDCGDTVQKYGLLALEENHMDIEDVDRALGNLFGTLIELGYFNEEDDTQNLIYDTAQKQIDDEIALQAALQSIVLLKNGPDDRNSPRRPLPLSITTHKKSL